VRALCLLVLILAAPARAEECPFAGQTPKLVVQLFFGQSVRGQGPVSTRAWRRFVADTVTPRLPDGFTVYDAYGQWMDRPAQVVSREQTKVIVVAADDSPRFRAAIDEIAAIYRRRFSQRSVGVLSNMGCGAF